MMTKTRDNEITGNQHITGNLNVDGFTDIGGYLEAGGGGTINGGLTVTGGLTVDGVEIPGDAGGEIPTIPKGTILMWAGSEGSVPEGWALCNGVDGTPDLQDRFIVGAGKSYVVGDTGGANQVKITTREMPEHSHICEVTDNGHTHAISLHDQGGDDDAKIKQSDYHPEGTGYTNLAETGISVTAENTGQGGGHENRPPYFAIIFIIKL